MFHLSVSTLGLTVNLFPQASVLGALCGLLLLLREPACRGDEVTSNTGRCQERYVAFDKFVICSYRHGV